MKKHILVISQYFYPENFRINDMCEEWIKRGYKVTVITGIPNYPKGKFFKGYSWFKKRKENYKGIDVIRLPIISRGKSSVRLIMNYYSFVISGWFWKSFSKLKPDLVFIFEVSPMTQALPGIWFAKRRKIPCYLYVQDLWPENLQIVGEINNKFILKRVGKMVDKIYARTNKILVTSPSFKESIMKRAVQSEKILYWPQYAEDFYKPIESTDNKQVFNIMFTGNIGEAQGLEILPFVALKLKENNYDNDVVFTLVGDGRNKTNLMKQVENMKVDHMFKFVGQIPANEIPNMLSKADVAFISFSDNELFRMTIPAKLQSYMACGKAILGVAEGETSKIILDSKCGLVSSPGQLNELYENIIKFKDMSLDEIAKYGTNAFKFADVHFNKNKLMNQFDELLEVE